MQQSQLTPLTHLSDEESLFFKSVSEFGKKEISPLIMEMDESETLNPTLIKKIFEMGLMAIEIPEMYGGSGGSFFQAILAIQALAQIDPSVSVFVDVQNTLVANALLKWASESVKQKYFPQFAKNKVGSYCLTESSSGSDAFALKTNAVDKGTHFELSGKKIFITNAKEASFFLVFANVNPSQGYKGITAFLVEKDFHGVSLGRKETKLGIRASSTCEVIFESVKVPKENIIGELGKGYKIAIETLNEGRIGISAQMLGLAEGALAAAVSYAKQREQFGKIISSFQGIQFQIAEMSIKIEAAKLMVYNAARLKDAGMNFVKEAAMAKSFAGEVAEYVASTALEIFGGYGFIKDFPAEKFYRDSKIGKIYEGTTNMQLQTIAKMILD
ncbi:acyl-CoA dehydrogenase family protein [Silvanigrella aquatica]|uniref:Short/branched chain specific acyl-CoA dehydrogenase, mitochondrial n=1 Tax=Silvanigrella aquatica TaxID=1915309 RepID=A0A1L4CZE4_9BACT|nr:acyl-CoA dehydrogenase family protein [Silvanigrella aquatica]APJ03310.1 acyl-CoA dehydrogenase [Silvanigrella aquatica]